MVVRSLVLGLVILVVPLYAAADGPWGYFRIPDLTQEQKMKMDTLWMAWIREKMAFRAALKQAKVDLRVRLSADTEDAAAIRQAIERISTIKAQMLESDVRFVLEVKKLLRPDQLRWFNLDLLGRGRYSDAIVDPDTDIMGRSGRGDFGPGGPPPQHPGWFGPGPGGPPPQGGPVFVPQGPQGPACVPQETQSREEKPRSKGR